MGGDVVLEGSDGDVVVGNGPDVGAGLNGPVGPCAVDPVVEASGIVAFLDDLCVGAVGEPGDLYALQLVQGLVGDVDVDEGSGRELAVPGLGGDEVGYASRDREVNVVQSGDGDCEGGMPRKKP